MATTHHRDDSLPFVDHILAARLTTLLARVTLTFPFWWSGFDKMLHPAMALSEIRSMGFPPLPYLDGYLYGFLLVVQIGGSFAIIANRYAWLGAGALGVFTAIVTFLAHAFWRLEGVARANEMNVFLEHIALIGGLVFAAMQSQVMHDNRHKR
jgi:transmembrane protein